MAWVYCCRRSSILEMGKAGWDFFTLLLKGRRRVEPRASLLLCSQLTLNPSQSPPRSQTSMPWLLSSTLSCRMLASRQTYLFFMERFRHSVRSASYIGQTEVWAIGSHSKAHTPAPNDPTHLSSHPLPCHRGL